MPSRHVFAVFSFTLLILPVCALGWKVPSVPLKNAAIPGTRYPMTGLGLNGPGYKLGQRQECWRYPVCCTKDHCPAINATRDWLKMGGTRIDTGYPYGDRSDFWGPAWGQTCGGWNRTSSQQLRGFEEQARVTGHWCDPHGIRRGIEESGVNREDMFITIKSGFAGPMKEIDKGYIPLIDHGQADYVLNWLGLEYADLYLMHEGELGNAGHVPAPICKFPTTKECRIRVFESCIEWMHNGKTRACGVANWELEWLQELLAANVTLPSVVQMKYHLHQSTAHPRVRAIKEFCEQHDIVFNGYSPLGRADWTTFEPPMTATVLEEPAVLDIASRIGRTPAQVILRWHVQQGIPTNPRSLNLEHMAQNLDVFDWELDDVDMARLSTMPQCNTTRGDPFMDGDPDDKNHKHANMIGPTLHC